MTDTQLLDWLSTHPTNSYWDGLGDEEWTLTTFASIGRGPDYRSALIALIADDRASRHGIPNVRDGAMTLE
jgi:hypothetical protein